MAILKKYKFKGLNLRDKHINKDHLYATDVQNVRLDSNGDLIKRYGFDSVVASTGSVENTEYKRGNTLIKQKSGGLEKLDSGILTAINRATGSVVDTFNNAGSYGEYNGVLYWADPAGNNELYKYDGYAFYRAGVPAPTVSTATGAGAFYYRVFLRFRDLQGNICSGDYVQFDSLADNAVFSVSQPASGFYTKYAEANGSQTIDSGNLTASVQAGHNYVAGDYIALYNTSTLSADPILVDSVTATTISFDSSSVSTNSYALSNAEPLEIRWEIMIYKSSNATFGYESNTFVSSVNHLTKSAGPISVTATSGPSNTNLEDDYDTTVLKGLPPKCKYIAFYNNIMILANNSDTSKIDTNKTQTDLESSYYWSDTGVGSTVETFPPFNVDTAGKSSEGEISGVYASSDNVVILKERQVYYGNGNPVLGTFRLRSALTNGIGCVSHRSVYEIEGGCIFMSEKGLYLARNGQQPIELSDIIEPYFKNSDFDLTRSKTVNLPNEEVLMIYIPTSSGDDVIVVYDYYYKEWFIDKGISATGGLCVIDNELHFSDSTNIYKQSSLYNDNGVAINAYYRSAFFDDGNPSLTKKFKKVNTVCTGNDVFELSLKSYVDWDESIENSSSEIPVDGVTCDDKSIPITKRKSISIELGNSNSGEGMRVSGFELEYEPSQRRAKGES